MNIIILRVIRNRLKVSPLPTANSILMTLSFRNTILKILSYTLLIPFRIKLLSKYNLYIIFEKKKKIAIESPTNNLPRLKANRSKSTRACCSVLVRLKFITYQLPIQFIDHLLFDIYVRQTIGARSIWDWVVSRHAIIIVVRITQA